MTRAISFKATCSETKVGWHVRVVGSCQALGNWDPKQGVALCTNAVQYPVWKSSAIRLEEDIAAEYKYVICDELGEAVQWEAVPNRTLHIGSLAARGICPEDGIITATERFGMPVEPDGTRFYGARRAGSGEFPERAHPFANSSEDPELFEPTMRERCASRSNLGAPQRSSSLSQFVAIIPEVAEASLEETVGGEAASELGGMVREESCSNLFFDSMPLDEEPQVSRGFERQYILLGNGPLGEGTFGLVWLCRPKEGGTERAAKIVRKARLHERDFNYLLGQDGEINTHLMMKHPHIVELFEHFDEQHTVTLVLEYCQGGDLFDAIIRQSQINGRGISENQAAMATTHTLLALSYLHKQLVVHRDIKCENILLSRAGVPLEQNVFKLCDFGFAARDRGAGLHERLGSPDTVAPEVVAGSRYSCPADLWSMGTLVYMMLSATSPFKAPTDAEVLRKVRTGSYSLQGALWDSISAPPKHVITSLMIVDAKLRPTAEETLQKAWLNEMPSAAVVA